VLGRVLIPLLIDAGHSVRALMRSAEKTRSLFGERVAIVECDLLAADTAGRGGRPEVPPLAMDREESLEADDWADRLRQLHDAGQHAVPVGAGQRSYDRGDWSQLTSSGRRPFGASLHGWDVSQLESNSGEWRAEG